MNVISIEEKAFYDLLDQLLTHGQEKYNVKQDKWISGEEAMQMLRITSKITLQKFRDEGRIRISQPEKKIILYDRDSINVFLNKHAKETF